MMWACNIQLTIPQNIYDALPAAKKSAARDIIRELKALAVQLPNEVTVKASWHWCTHDKTPATPCEEQDI